MVSTVTTKALRNLGSTSGLAATGVHPSACSQPAVTVVNRVLRMLGQEPVVPAVPVPPIITTPPTGLSTTCPIGTPVLGVPFSVFLTATGGTAPYTFVIASGLPDGLSLNGSTGEISGTPTVAGTFSFTVHVEDADGKTADSGGCELTVAEVVITSGCPLGPLTVNIPFPDFTLTAVGGDTPYTWSISAGSLPDGLSLDSGTGVISGTPTLEGTFNFTPHIHTNDGLDADLEGGCSIDVNATQIFRPLTAFEFEDPAFVNPARTHITNGTNAIDDDLPIGESLTYAECVMNSCTSTVFGLASLNLYDFPEPSLTPDHAVLHIITEHTLGFDTDFMRPGGPSFAESSIFKAYNPNPIGSGQYTGAVGGDAALGSTDVAQAKTEFTYTIDSTSWASDFGSSAANIFIRCSQWDTQNFNLSPPALFRVYDCWIEYFF